MKRAEKLISVLENSGHEAYLVGGCVRDMLMGVAPHDYDITTSARPDEIVGAFSEYRTVLTGIKHGTVTVICDGEPYEITTFRADGEYADHRHPESVTFSTRLADDLCRRDFTVNAMAYSKKTGLIDLYGGENDIKNGVIRAVGEPKKRFDEDALRILRAIRFASEKDFIIEESTASAMREKLPLIKFVSAERIFVELKKLLLGKGVLRILRDFSDIVGEIIPPLKPCIDFDQQNYHHIYDVYEHTAYAVSFCPPDVTVRLAALLHDVGKPPTFSLKDGVGHFYGHPSVSVELAEQTLGALKCDNATKNAVLTLIKYHDLVIEPTEKAVRRMMNKIGEELLEKLLELKSADNLAQAPEYHGRLKQYDEIRSIMGEIKAKNECFSLNSLAVRGEDIMALGARGRDIGRILDALLMLVIDGELSNEKDALISKARELL